MGLKNEYGAKNKKQDRLSKEYKPVKEQNKLKKDFSNERQRNQDKRTAK